MVVGEGSAEKVGERLARGRQRRLAKGWRGVGREGWRKVGEGLAKGWRVSVHPPTLQLAHTQAGNCCLDKPLQLFHLLLLVPLLPSLHLIVLSGKHLARCWHTRLRIMRSPYRIQSPSNPENTPQNTLQNRKYSHEGSNRALVMGF